MRWQSRWLISSDECRREAIPHARSTTVDMGDGPTLGKSGAIATIGFCLALHGAWGSVVDLEHATDGRVGRLGGEVRVELAGTCLSLIHI